MSVRSDVELLRQVHLFAEVDRAQLQLLVFSGERIDLAAEEILFEAGSTVAAGYLVLQGKGEALRSGGPEPQRLAIIEPGAFIAELAMIANLPVSVTMRAQIPMRLLKIGHDLFLRVCSEFPDAGAKVLAALAQKLDTSLEDLHEVQDYLDRACPFSRS